jgi:hypothetical protein
MLRSSWTAYYGIITYQPWWLWCTAIFHILPETNKNHAEKRQITYLQSRSEHGTLPCCHSTCTPADPAVCTYYKSDLVLPSSRMQGEVCWPWASGDWSLSLNGFYLPRSHGADWISTGRSDRGWVRQASSMRCIDNTPTVYVETVDCNSTDNISV